MSKPALTLMLPDEAMFVIALPLASVPLMSEDTYLNPSTDIGALEFGLIPSAIIAVLDDGSVVIT